MVLMQNDLWSLKMDGHLWEWITRDIHSRIASWPLVSPKRFTRTTQPFFILLWSSFRYHWNPFLMMVLLILLQMKLTGLQSSQWKATRLIWQKWEGFTGITARLWSGEMRRQHQKVCATGAWQAPMVIQQKNWLLGNHAGLKHVVSDFLGQWHLPVSSTWSTMLLIHHRFFRVTFGMLCTWVGVVLGCLQWYNYCWQCCQLPT